MNLEKQIEINRMKLKTLIVEVKRKNNTPLERKIARIKAEQYRDDIILAKRWLEKCQ